MATQLNYIHLCDAANIDSNGKISILGIFGKIFLPSVPSTFLKFTVVCNLTIDSLKQQNNEVRFQLYDEKNQEVSANPKIQLKFTTNDHQKNTEMNVILDVNNLEFRSFGKHTLRVYLNNKEIGRTPLIVEERKKA